MSGLILSLSNLALRIASWLSWFPALASRVVVGYVFLSSGWGKIHNLPHVTEFFRELGIPYPEYQAPFVAIVELIGGLFLILGFLSRIVSIPLCATMVVAILTAKLSEVQTFDDLFGFSEFLYIILMSWIMINGPGNFSVDRLLFKNKFKK